MISRSFCCSLNSPEGLEVAERRDCERLEMHAWLLQKYIALLERVYPGASQLLTSKFDELSENQKLFFRKLATAISIFHALSGMLRVLAALLLLLVGNVLIFQNYGAEDTQRFGSIWISVSVAVIFLDISPFTLLMTRDIDGRSIFPEEISAEAVRIHEKLKPAHDALRRTVELSMLVLGTLMSGYGDLVHLWAVQVLA
ncbi:hypothetical protein [Tritonibacter scottomollicae]|uniref:Uncharacterized protein n=1 Tax=Tritonibacter scottomollicae TaxID=483013 RepID=A0A2T1ALP6_TRISK|nr:hypothetical protein [Tritonibacter scottomollicae]PRZ49529.1 hypothetical protein CLV89_102273 [Tritonibacter scottomollicae]